MSFFNFVCSMCGGSGSCKEPMAEKQEKIIQGLKVKTTKEQEEEKKKAREKKVKMYRSAYGRIVEKRKNGEKDEEGLQISRQILEMIPDIASLWNYRREILLKMTESLENEELQKHWESDQHLTEICLRANPKSYGAWHHRMWLMDTMPLPDWSRELELCNKYLELDERNFHCWDYRRFVVARASVPPDQELRYSDSKIATNFSNYSSWHYRSRLLPMVYPDPRGMRPVEEDCHRKELELVQNAAFTDPNDQSAWFYQRWLLGRSQPPQTLTCALFSPTISFVTLMNPALVEKNCMHFHVNDRPVPGTWQSADGSRYSSIWTFTPSSPLERISGIVSLTMWGSDPVPLPVSNDGSRALFRAQPMFGAPLSPALSSVMEDELDSCHQLLEFEPDSKWTLLTSMLLMQSIDRKKYKRQSMETLDKLKEVDFLRANYYRDTRSRLQLEYAIEHLRAEKDAICLSHFGLTALYHTPLLALVQSIDLGNNQLERGLPQLSALQCCETLILDNNELKSLETFGAMPSLRELSLKNNLISSADELRHLTVCPNLENLDLQGNPLDCGESLRIAVRDTLPSIRNLNGAPI